MPSQSWIDDLLTFWKEHRVDTAAHKPDDVEIATYEAQYGVRLPDDLRAYLQRVNGNLHGELLDFDHDMNSFLPLSAMKPEGEAYEGHDRTNMFVFADHCISCLWWCVELTAEPADVTPIYFGGCGDEKKLVASSLQEFFASYLNDGNSILPGQPLTTAEPSLWKRLFKRWPS